MNGESGDAPFLERWSKRKREAERTAPDEGAAPPPAPAKTQPAPELTDADLPPPESLAEDADYSAFLAPGVSDALRRRALKRLFGQARFNVPDGLDDYADDFSGFPPLGDLVTREMRRMLEPETGTEEGDRAEAPDTETSDDVGETPVAVDPSTGEPGNKNA